MTVTFGMVVDYGLYSKFLTAANGDEQLAKGAAIDYAISILAEVESFYNSDPRFSTKIGYVNFCIPEEIVVSATPDLLHNNTFTGNLSRVLAGRQIYNQASPSCTKVNIVITLTNDLPGAAGHSNGSLSVGAGANIVQIAIGSTLPLPVTPKSALFLAHEIGHNFGQIDIDAAQFPQSGSENCLGSAPYPLMCSNGVADDLAAVNLDSITIERFKVRFNSVCDQLTNPDACSQNNICIGCPSQIGITVQNTRPSTVCGNNDDEVVLKFLITNNCSPSDFEAQIQFDPEDYEIVSNPNGYTPGTILTSGLQIHRSNISNLGKNESIEHTIVLRLKPTAVLSTLQTSGLAFQLARETGGPNSEIEHFSIRQTYPLVPQIFENMSGPGLILSEIIGNPDYNIPLNGGSQRSLWQLNTNLIVDVDYEWGNRGGDDSFNSHIFVGDGHFITVDGATLRIVEETVIKTCGDQLWRGLRVENGGRVEINRSIISDAMIAVLLENNSEAKIDYTTFSDNFVAIYVKENDYGITSFRGNYFEGSNSIKTTNIPYFHEYLPPYLTRSFAGIISNNSNLALHGGSATYTTFTNLPYGIIAYDASLHLEQMEFVDLPTTPFALGYVFAGTGILASSSTATHTLTHRGLGSNIPSFQNMRRAIDLQGMNVTAIEKNRIEQTKEAIRVNGALTEVNIRDNVIFDAAYRAIDIGHAAPGAEVSVHSNTIRTLPGARGIQIRGMNIPAPGEEPKRRIFANNIAVDASAIGILALTERNLSINNNDIEAETGDDWTGMLLNGAHHGEFCSNDITGTTTQNGYAIRMADGEFNTLQCNETNDTRWGAYITMGGHAPEQFRGNTFGNHHVGLQLTPTGLLGKQTNTGNRWTGSYGSGYGAINEATTPSGVFASQFTYDQNLLPTYPGLLPVFQADDPEWFIPNQTAPTFECTIANGCNFGIFEPLPDDPTEEDIPNGGLIEGGPYETEREWLSYRYLNNKLRREPDMADNNPAFQQFMTSEVTTTGRLADFQETVTDLTAGTGTIQTLQAHLTTLQTDLLDASRQRNFAGVDTAYYDQLIGQLRTDADDLQAQLETEGLNRLVSLANQSNQFDDFLNYTGSDYKYDLNEQFVNRLYVDHILLNDFVLPKHYQKRLKDLAALCPIEGGTAVFKARGLLNSFGFETDYSDRNCDELPVRGRSKEQYAEGVSAGYVLLPNPARHEVLLRSESGFGEQSVLSVYNSFGKLYHTDNLVAGQNSYRIITSTYPPGVYFVRVAADHQPVFQTRLIIVQ